MKFNLETIKNHKVSDCRAMRLRQMGYNFDAFDGLIDLLQLGLDEMGQFSLGDIRKDDNQKTILDYIIDNEQYVIYPLLSRYKKLLYSIFHKVNCNYKLSYEIPLILIGDIEFIKQEKFDENNLIFDPFGVYYPIINIIIIDAERILRFIQEKELDIEYSVFFEKVLSHELGHWISHELFIDGKIWDDTNFLNSSMDVKEFWANYLSYLMMDDEQRLFQKYLAKNHQTMPYQRYLEAIDKDSLDVLMLLSLREKLNWNELSEKIKSIINPGWML